MKSIIYAEDHADYGEIVRRLHAMVQKKFHAEVEFTVVQSWIELRNRVEADPPSVILLDLNLPPDSAAEVLAKLFPVAGPEFPPVMVLTGDKYALDLRRKCILSGADDFMLKEDANHHPELLCERIYHCHLRRMRDESRP